MRPRGIRKESPDECRKEGITRSQERPALAKIQSDSDFEGNTSENKIWKAKKSKRNVRPRGTNRKGSKRDATSNNRGKNMSKASRHERPKTTRQGPRAHEYEEILAKKKKYARRSERTSRKNPFPVSFSGCHQDF